MAWLFDERDNLAEVIKHSNAQMFISGGHGGLVTYDGKGGPLKKEGAPMDRLLVNE